MKDLALSLTFLLSFAICSAQNPYKDSLKQAHQYYLNKEYLKSAKAYERAFKQFPAEIKGYQIYNAACSWSLANNQDAAFNWLELAYQKYHYDNFNHLIKDEDLKPLHADGRWLKFITKIQLKFNSPLRLKLDSIRADDQRYRVQLIDAQKKYGVESKEAATLADKMNQQDSINILKVVKLLDESGWPSNDSVGENGVSALFLVIQHAELNIQQKYYPMMKAAVKKGNLRAGDFALLEDRIAIRTGKKQIYGSQVGYDDHTQKYYVSPIEDEANVNKRRASVGLEPLEVYLKNWNIVYAPK